MSRDDAPNFRDLRLSKSELCVVIKNLLSVDEKTPINEREKWEAKKLDSAIEKLEKMYINMEDE